jgi:hypothetical protein
MLGILLNFTYKYNLIKFSKIIIDYYPNILNNNIDIFYKACDSGDIEFAIYLYDKIYQFDINIDYETIFISVCEKQELNIAMWLLSINQIINTVSNNEKVLQLAIVLSLFDIAEQILYNNPLLDLSFNDNIIFKDACINGNMELIKWIFKIIPDISVYSVNNYICINNSTLFKTSITNWINLHNDKYHLLIIDNIFKCKLKLKIKFEFRDMDDIETCIICMENMCDIITNCNHQFCMECIVKFYNKNNEFFCPMCRKMENLFFSHLI